MTDALKHLKGGTHFALAADLLHRAAEVRPGSCVSTQFHGPGYVVQLVYKLVARTDGSVYHRGRPRRACPRQGAPARLLPSRRVRTSVGHAYMQLSIWPAKYVLSADAEHNSPTSTLRTRASAV